MSFFDKLKSGLKKTRDSFVGKVDTVLAAFGKVDEELFEELEDILITSDFGVSTAEKVMEGLRRRVKEDKVTDPEQGKALLQEEIAELLTVGGQSELDFQDTPVVITVIGVNGVGKTPLSVKWPICTGKPEEGFAGGRDTFRAAAIDQLDIWAQRAEVDIIKQGRDRTRPLYFERMPRCKGKRRRCTHL